MILDLFTVLAAVEVGGGPDVGKLLGQFAQYGIVGVMVGYIVPKYVMNNLTAVRDPWREVFEKERDVRQLTREQLAKAEERGDVAIEQGKPTHVLEELGHRPQLHRSA